MVFKISAGFTHVHNQRQTSHIMKLVCLATLPSIAVQFWFFGWGVIFLIIIGCVSTIVAEASVLWLRKMAVKHIIDDNSALLTGILLAISIPPLAPWWMVMLGSIFAIIVAKLLYGGLGCNLFNPAMVGYVVLLVSFPVLTINWLPLRNAATSIPGIVDTLHFIFNGHSVCGEDIASLRIGINGVGQATLLDQFKTLPHIRHSSTCVALWLSSICNISPRGNEWEWINLAWLLGGLFLLWKRVINWHIPISFLTTLALLSAIFSKIFLLNSLDSAKLHLLSGGATMLGTFFILTDPVTAPTTNVGRLIFGSLTGLLVWLIRSFGGYLDGMAFAVLLANITVPLIDYYTRP